MELTNENYFSQEMQMKYMGSSQFKSFCECELKAMAELKGLYGRTLTDSLLVGSYVDSYFTGDLEAFKAENSDIFTKAGELKSPFRKAEEIIDRIKQDEVFMEHISGENQVIMTGKICGVEVKIKVDSLRKDDTVDLKIMKDLKGEWKNGEYLEWFEVWKYNIQAAIYQSIRSQNDGEIKPFILAVATKESSTDLRLFKFTQTTLDSAMAEVVGKIERFDLIKKGKVEPIGCKECDYCKSQKKLIKGEYELI